MPLYVNEITWTLMQNSCKILSKGSANAYTDSPAKFSWQWDSLIHLLS